MDYDSDYRIKERDLSCLSVMRVVEFKINVGHLCAYVLLSHFGVGRITMTTGCG